MWWYTTGGPSCQKSTDSSAAPLQDAFFKELRITNQAIWEYENRPPEGGRRFLLVAGGRYAGMRDLARLEIPVRSYGSTT
jgi:hypothetical protein